MNTCARSYIISSIQFNWSLTPISCTNCGYLYSDDFLVACIAATQLRKLVTKKGMVMTKQETREDVLRFATDRENREDSSFASAAHLQP